MRNFLKHRRSKRVFARTLLALVLSTASVFLVGLASPAKAYAQDPMFSLPSSPSWGSQGEIEQLKINFKTKAQMIDEAKDDVQKAQEEAEAIAQQKEEVASEVGDLKTQIATLQAKLAEKKRLEALRIVPQSRYAADSAGDLYAPGNCTYYVKSRRPDLSNSLGNANTWYYKAQELGYKTGTMAKTGAVGTTTAGWLGHVVYVEKWLGNGQILISEMNINGLWSTQTRIADESEFVYIYELP